MGEWREIASAPRDGTNILAWDGETIWMAEWCPYVHAFIQTVTDAPLLSAGQLEDCTHWQPLPLPPHPAQGQQKENE